jgi:serine protease Do
MNAFRKGLTTILIGGISIGSYIVGSTLVRDVRFAQAEDQVQASRDELSKAEDIAAVYRAVGKAVEPSVVSIEVHKLVKGAHRGLFNFDDDTLKRFFPDGKLPPELRNRDNGGDNGGDNNNGDNNDDNSDDMEQIAGGSGVIVDADGTTGYVLTNNHVAGGAESMTITLWDGRKITEKDCKVVGTDPKSDMAVVKITADKLIPIKWGDSDQLAKGDMIFAFGSPFGYVGSMTHGIVSALHRDDIFPVSNKFSYENFIQVDAPINPGNSGGPLVNLRGELVGINTAIATETGAFNGIGFAIPSNQAKAVYTQLKANGKVVRGFIGVGIADVSKNLDLAKTFNYDGTDGVIVEQMYKDTPASGKLQRGDIVTAINGKKMVNSDELRNLVASTTPGKELTFTIFRDGKTQDMAIKVGEQPEELATAEGATPPEANQDNSADETSVKKLGLHLTDASDDALQHFNLNAGLKGALITQVDPRSIASKAGLVPGILITQVGDTTVTSAKEASDALNKQDLTKGIRLSVTTHEGDAFVVLRQE